MKRLPAIIVLPALLLTAGARGQQPAAEPPRAEWPQQLEDTLRTEQAALQQEAHRAEASAAELGELPAAPFDPTAPMPTPLPGQSAAVADGGLLFDRQHAYLTYIGNVRVSDPRLHLRAARRLYIALPPEDEQKAATEAPAQPAAPAAPLAQASEQQKAPEPKKKPAGQAEPPALLVVDSAAVDTRGSRILLEGLSAVPSITLTRGKDSMTLHPTENGAPAGIYAGAEGDVLLLGSRMVFEWHSERGETYRLEAAGGPVLYAARSGRLSVRGESRLTTATGVLTCDELLEIRFAVPPQTPAPAGKKPTPFSALTSAEFREIRSATAAGHVALTSPATDTRPPATATGDYLVYSAAESQCLLAGRCALTYGGFTLHETDAQGRIRMVADGSIFITSGAALSGAYERPSAEKTPGLAIPGAWSTGNSIHYDAASNSILLPEGIRAADALATLTAGGATQLFLAPRENAHPVSAKPGIPALVITEQGSVRRVVAGGGVRLQAAAEGTRPAGYAEGEALDATLSTGEALLTAEAGQQVIARYGAYELTAKAPADSADAAIRILPNGDITARGEHIEAVLPGEKGATRMACTGSMQLLREQARLILGENSRINSPEGILTARAPLTAELIGSDTPTHAPKGYPQLSYNYSGLRRATTPGGGTLRTTHASMQCEGSIDVELIPGKQDPDMRKNLRAASAHGRVLVAGKDASGRLMRAGGDHLTYDPATGNFHLRGSKVTLSDRYNTHTATGSGACVTIDPNNNVRITGKRQTTSANNILKQMDNNKKK